MANIFNQFEDFLKESSSSIQTLDSNHVYQVQIEEEPALKPKIKQNTIKEKINKGKLSREKHLDHANYKKFLSKSHPNFTFYDNSRRTALIKSNFNNTLYSPSYNQNLQREIPASKQFFPPIKHSKMISIPPNVTNQNYQYSVQSSNIRQQMSGIYQPNQNIYQSIPNYYQPEVTSTFQYNSVYPRNSNYRPTVLQKNSNFISQTSPVLFHLSYFVNPYKPNYNMSEANSFLSTPYPMIKQILKTYHSNKSNPNIFSSHQVEGFRF